MELDRQLLLLLNFDGSPFWDSFFWFMSEKYTWVPMYIILLWVIYRRYGFKYMSIVFLFIIASVGATDQIANFFKDNTPKFRPTHTDLLDGLVNTVRGYRGGNYGSVSAHAATTFSIAAITSWVLRNRVYTISIMCWCGLVCYSRIYLGVHFPFDIMFGLMTGLFVSWLAIFFLGKTLKYFRLDDSTVAHKKEPAGQHTEIAHDSRLNTSSEH